MNDYKYHLYIACIGDTFEDGVYDSIVCASQYCGQQGGRITIDVIGNHCVQPYHGLAMMRNTGIVDSLLERATHLLIIDNDILLHDESVLHRMVDLDKDACVPWFDQSSLDHIHHIQDPQYTSDTGSGVLAWSIMSCVLFKTTIFTAKGVDCRLFADHLAIAEDAYYWRWLRLFDVLCHQDTAIKVKMLRPPTSMWELDKSSIAVRHEDKKVFFDFRRPDGASHEVR